MSSEYVAEVFFGAFVRRTTPLGKRLCEYVDKAGGTPAETEIRGVEICEVGSQPTGEIWMVVSADGGGLSYSRESDTVAPRMLTENPAWRPALAMFFEHLAIKKPPPVGWYFASSVS